MIQIQFLVAHISAHINKALSLWRDASKISKNSLSVTGDYLGVKYDTLFFC